MFSVARPQFTEPLPAPFRAAEELLAGTKGVTAASVRALAVRPLKPTGQPSNERIGFFETGMFIGAGITLSVVLPILGYTTWILSRKGFEFISRIRH
jgi:hypothetical protein